MAVFYPDDDFDRIRHKSERDVARALQATLGPKVRVYHGQLWLRQVPNYGGRGTHLKEGETDFLILDPDHGLLVVEVKGGPVEYDPASGKWYYDRFGRREPMERNPVEQARTNVHALEERLLKDTLKGWTSLPCPYGYALVFPDHDPVGTPPPGADHAIVLGARDLPILGQRLTEALKKWRQTDLPAPMSPDVWRRVCEGVGGSFRLIEVLSRRVDAQEEVLVRLTREQESALEGLYVNPRARVMGPAGSGKTMLAMDRARRFALQGQSTLFLCYNRHLADWLHERVPTELRPLLEVYTFNGLCRALCDRAKIAYKPPPEEEREARRAFFEETAPNLLDSALNRVKDRYAAVVVDEGQDFRPNWWTPIELLNVEEENGPLYVFYDPAQNLYVGEQFVLPHLPVVYQLRANCRNTRRIAELCGTILGSTVPTREDAPEGAAPVEEVISGKQERRERCNQQVREWLSKGGLRPSQVAILSPWSQGNSCLAGVTSLSGTPLTSDLGAWQRNEGVLFATVRAFKGLEADALILTDLPAPKGPERRSELYVACSRAKHLLRAYYAEPRDP